jgi:short-subunit dehydrogenase
VFEIQDKVIVITGATGALGGALALSLAKAKAQLVILGRNQELLDELSSKLN